MRPTPGYIRAIGANSDLFREYYEILDRAGQSGEFEEWLSCFSDDVVWVAIEDAPDAGTYRGHDGLRSYLEDWLATVDDMRFEIREPIEIGDFVVSDTRVKATVKGTDDAIDLPYAIAARIVDGKIAYGKEFRERDDAIAFAEGGGA